MRLTFSSLVIFGVVALAGPALAHVAERAFVMLLPTRHTMIGGALTVALTVAVTAFIPGDAFARLFRPRVLGRRPALPLRPVFQWLGFVTFTGLIWLGFFGPTDPLANLLPLTVWTLWWVGLTFAQAVFGDLWRSLNPWSAPHCVLRAIAGGGHDAPFRLPDAVGMWPAILFLFGFGWFELVDLAPDNPTRLAQVALGYWAITLSGMALFGEEAWASRCECFTVFFRLIARLATVWSVALADGRVEMRAALPGARLIAADGAPGPSGPSGALFILLALSTVTFDGLNETFWWLGLIGVNPLEFPGRSAVIGENTLGLAAAWAALAAAFGGAVWLGDRLAGGGAGLGESLARLAFSLMPIALAYHFAHYLTVVMLNGQYALVALNDPLGSGARLPGLDPRFVTTSFFYDRASVEAIWTAQSATIVIGHVIAVLAAHGIALRLYPDARRAALSQIPLGALMVGYTLLGLWLLASPTA